MTTYHNQYNKLQEYSCQDNRPISPINVLIICRRKSTFSELLPTADPLIIDLVSKLLQFNPTRRLTTEQALEHPYVAKSVLFIVTALLECLIDFVTNVMSHHWIIMLSRY